MTLETLWFILIAVLWTGFFILEGFDLGVGMLHGVLGKDEAGRRAAINTIGPLWDGNEVWLIVAAAAMFAAFPGWYATMFSGFYVVVVLLLAALIARGISFEFRGKRPSSRWRRTFDALMTGGSVLVPLLTGIALGNLLHGLPIDSSGEYTGGLLELLNPYALCFGVTLLALCAFHGATFLGLKTSGEVQRRARTLARRTAPPTALLVLLLTVWTHSIADRGVVPNVLQVAAVLAVLAAGWLLREGADGWSFVATSVAMGTTVLSLFADLYPRLMVSSTSSTFDLTVQNTASGAYALKVMTVVTMILFPVVLIYQGWTYYVFRARVHPDSFSVGGKPAPVGTTGAAKPVVPASSPPEPPAPAEPAEPHGRRVLRGRRATRTPRGGPG